MKSKFLKFISVYEMVGGILGILVTIYLGLFSSNSILNPAMPINFKIFNAIIFTFILVLYILSCVGGFFLWKEKKSGIVYSIIIQVFQIPHIMVPGFIYIFQSGLRVGTLLTVSSNVVKTTILFNLGSTFSIYLGSKIEFIAIGINFFSIIVIGYLLRFRVLHKSTPIIEEHIVANDLNETKTEENEEPI